MKTITLSEIMNGAWKDHSLSTCEDRGIPHIVDGLKPVQRYLLLQGYKSARHNFDKVAAIGGSVAALGYGHGEASASGALTAMGASFSNNLPLFEGDGQFGNVLDPSPAQPRYIFARLAPYIDDIFKDTDLAPENPDPEILTPLYYLPIIPICLLNGMFGIATGYSTNIPPHSAVSIIDNLIRLTEGKKIKEIKPRYYSFTGTIERGEDRYVLTGCFERKTPIKIIVTDLAPIFNTSDSYEKFLKKLVEKGTISSYENYSGKDKFNFEIVLKKGQRWTDEEVISNLKLSSNHIWNLITVMPNGKLKVWDKNTGIEDILMWFYDFRIEYIQKRIDKKKVELAKIGAYYAGFIKFLEDVVSKKLAMKEMSDSDLHDILETKYAIPDAYIGKIMDAPIRTFTTTKIEETKKKYEKVLEDISYYESTTKEIEYRKDLETLKKVAKAFEK